MVSWNVQKQNIDGTFYSEGFCLADDTMPTDGVANGSSLFAIDTGETYYFDAETGSWGVPVPPAPAE